MVSSYTFVTRTCLDRDREELQIEADRITEFHHIHVCVIATLRYVDTREKYWFLFLLTLPKKSGDIWLTTVNQFSVLRKSSIWFGGKSDSGARFAWASVCLPFQFSSFVLLLFGNDEFHWSSKNALVNCSLDLTFLPSQSGLLGRVSKLNWEHFRELAARKFARSKIKHEMSGGEKKQD